LTRYHAEQEGFASPVAERRGVLPEVPQVCESEQMKVFNSVSGPLIFAVVNVNDGRRYFGVCTTKGSVAKRIRQHGYWLRRSRHHCKPLQAAYDRDGAEAFRIELVERCWTAGLAYARLQVWLDRAAEEGVLFNVRHRVRLPRHLVRQDVRSRVRPHQCERPTVAPVSVSQNVI
jgi:hypothetical protein